MKNNIFLILLIAIALTGLQSCETEVDLNADYKSTTIVYGLLDPIQDTQWIKINRTFLGSGNNLDYAMVRDSSEYKWDEFNSIKMLVLDDEEVVQTFNIQEKEISSKSINGIFYGPTQTVYFFATPNPLNPNYRYRLEIDFKDRPDVSAETSLVVPSDVSFVNGAGIQARSIKLATLGSLPVEYKIYNGNLSPDESAPFYELALRIHFTERTYTDETHTVLVEERPFTLEYGLGSFDLEDRNTSNRIPFVVSGENIFQFIGSSLKKDNNVVYQLGVYDPTDTPYEGTVAMEFVAYAGGEELYTYTQVNSPTTGIIQERPTYTNVVNGLGLLSSKSEVVLKDIPLTVLDPALVPDISTMYAFRYSEYTSDINFCDPGAEATEYIPTCE